MANRGEIAGAQGASGQLRIKRIATEEAWSIPEIPQAQFELLHGPCPPDDPSLRMGAAFAS